MRAADTRTIEGIAPKTASKMGLAEFIYDLGNLASAIRAETVQLDERSIPRMNFFLKNVNGVVDDSHLVS